MKTVSGKVESGFQISLPRAAKFLSKFSASDNEASQAFGAYLKRTSGAFSELVQLHKELKISDKVKKDLSNSNVAEGTMNSAIIPQEDDLEDITNRLSNSEMEKHVDEGGIDAGTKNTVDGSEERNDARRSKKGMGVRSSEGSISVVVADVVGAVEKSKEKSGSDEIVAIPKKDEPDGDRDAINANEVNNEMVDGIRESKKTKKKNNRHEVERTEDIMAAAEKDEARDDHNAFNVNKVNNEMVDGSAESKKMKTKKIYSCEAERTKEIVATAEKDEADGDYNALNVNEMVVGSEDTKKTKRKKRDRCEVERIDEIVAITEKDDADGDHKAFIVDKVKNDMLDGSENTKKTKRNKREKHEAERTDGVEEIAENAKAAGGPDAFNVNKADNEMVYGSGETKKTERKKRDSHEVERSDGTVRIGKEVGSHSNIQNDDHGAPALTVQNGGQEQKKRKKKNKKKNEVKEERDSCSIRNAEQSKDVIVNNVVENSDGKERKRKNTNVENANDISDGKKHKKKQTHVTEESTYGNKIEIGAAKKKDNKKRKHERFAGGEFDAEEVHKSKKKKT